MIVHNHLPFWDTVIELTSDDVLFSSNRQVIFFPAMLELILTLSCEV